MPPYAWAKLSLCLLQFYYYSFVRMAGCCGWCTVRAIYPMDLIDWTKCNTRNKKEITCTKVRHTHAAHTQNECDRDGQQRRLYASIEQININVHWMEIWQHIFLSDNMKYGNSPQHSTDSQRQTYSHTHTHTRAARKEGKPKRTQRATRAHTQAHSLDRMYQIYSVTSMLWARGGKEEKRQKKSMRLYYGGDSGSVDGGNGCSHNTAISAIAAAATPLPIALWIARGQRIIIRIIILLLYISIDVRVSVSKTEHRVNKMNTEKCEKYVFSLLFILLLLPPRQLFRQ